MPFIIEAIVTKLQGFGCVRINGLNTFNSLAENEDGRVPSPEQVPCHWLGRWGTDKDLTFICLATGDLFVLYGRPNDELLKSLTGNTGLCPNGSELKVPYFHGESIPALEILARARNPYHHPA